MYTTGKSCLESIPCQGHDKLVILISMEKESEDKIMYTHPVILSSIAIGAVMWYYEISNEAIDGKFEPSHFIDQLDTDFKSFLSREMLKLGLSNSQTNLWMLMNPMKSDPITKKQSIIPQPQEEPKKSVGVEFLEEFANKRRFKIAFILFLRRYLNQCDYDNIRNDFKDQRRMANFIKDKFLRDGATIYNITDGDFNNLLDYVAMMNGTSPNTSFITRNDPLNQIERSIVETTMNTLFPKKVQTQQINNDPVVISDEEEEELVDDETNYEEDEESVDEDEKSVVNEPKISNNHMKNIASRNRGKVVETKPIPPKKKITTKKAKKAKKVVDYSMYEK
jgi:hypothetical protein